MPVTQRDTREALAGVAVILVTGAFFYRSFAYGIGTPGEMGAGFFPMVLSGAGMLAGAVIFIGGLTQARAASEEAETIAWRPLIGVLAGIGAFALLLPRFGLAPAIMACAALAALGDGHNRPFAIAVLAVVLALACWAVFTLGLGLPMPLIAGIG